MSGYTEEQTRRWLGWLAQSMTRHGQTMFLLEDLQPSWLPKQQQRWYFMLCRATILGLLIVFLCASPDVFGIAKGGRSLWAGIKIGTLNVVLLGYFLLGYVVIRRMIGRGMKFLSWQETSGGDPSSYIRPVGRVGWSSDEFVQAFSDNVPNTKNSRMKLGCVGCSMGCLLGPLLGPAYLTTVFYEAIVAGLQPRKVELTTQPNFGIRLSLMNACKFLLPIPLLTLWTFLGDKSSLDPVILSCVLLLIAARCGGLAVLRHYTLRLFLWLNGYTPANYVKCLDYAANELGFLQKAGGGHIFMHRYLLEYFAESGHAVVTETTTV